MEHRCYHDLDHGNAFDDNNLYGDGDECEQLFSHSDDHHHGEPAADSRHHGCRNIWHHEQRRHYLQWRLGNANGHRRRYLCLEHRRYHDLDHGNAFDDNDLYRDSDECEQLFLHRHNYHHGKPASNRRHYRYRNIWYHK